ncbi:MAG: energy-coupling factor transporter transmembrane component T family protein [Anaerolineae bacterium]
MPDALFVPGNSWLHQLDPRVKLAFAVLATVALLSVENGWVFLGCLALCHAMLLAARVPPARLLGAWRMMLPITLMILLLWPFFTPVEGAAAWRFGPLALSWESVQGGVAAALRVNALAFAFLVWLFSTDQPALVLGFRQLGLPYTWGVTLAITLRYIPTLYSTLERVLDAQRARGLVTAHANPLCAARAYLPALVPVLIQALRTADTLSRALEARAFNAPNRQHTHRRQLHFRATDALALAWIVLTFGGVIAARVAGWV